MAQQLTAGPSLTEIEANIRHWTDKYRASTTDDAREKADLARFNWIDMWLDRQASCN